MAAPTSIETEHGTLGMPQALPSGGSLGERVSRLIEYESIFELASCKITFIAQMLTHISSFCCTVGVP